LHFLVAFENLFSSPAAPLATDWIQPTEHKVGSARGSYLLATIQQMEQQANLMVVGMRCWLAKGERSEAEKKEVTIRIFQSRTFQNRKAPPPFRKKKLTNILLAGATSLNKADGTPLLLELLRWTELIQAKG